MLYAIAALLVFQLAGEILVQWLGIPLPGPLAGMVLLLAALCFYGRLPDKLRSTSNGLLGHLMLLFIAPVAGVVTQLERISQDWIPFVAACLGATALTMVVSALTLQFMLKRAKRRQ